MVDTVNAVNRKPEVIVFAGPNGSGKSTITSQLRPPNVPYINADDIQSALCCSNLEAAQQAEVLREDYLSKGQSFCFETVLSTDRNLKLLKKAKDAGYFIRCYYVLTADPEINVARVASRVSAGGHGVPADKIRSRYERSLNLIKEVVPVCDVCHIYDSSLTSPRHMMYRIFRKRKDDYSYCTLRGLWHKEDIVALTGINEVLPAALNEK